MKYLFAHIIAGHGNHDDERGDYRSVMRTIFPVPFDERVEAATGAHERAEEIAEGKRPQIPDERPEASFTIYAVTVNHDGTLTAWRCTITRIPPATPEQRLSAALDLHRAREAVT